MLTIAALDSTVEFPLEINEETVIVTLVWDDEAEAWTLTTDVENVFEELQEEQNN